MKIKLAISSLTFFSFFIFGSTAFATSGACSSHGGVNCSVSNSYSSVVCNDGTSDSSTNFSDLQECKAVTTCDSGQVTAFSASRGLIGSSFGQSASAKCESTNTSVSVPSYNSNTYSSQGYLVEQAVDRKMQEYCVGKYGTNSKYSPEKKTCGCNTDYWFSDSKVCTPKREILNSMVQVNLNKLPEYKNLVDVNYVIDLALNPENDNKTMKQLIIDTYSSKLPVKVIDVQKATSTQATTTAVSTPISKPTLSKVLKIGSSGAEVKILQSMLGVEPTGYFGAKTREAVVRFQKLNKLPQSGLVGDLTRKALNK
jgi:Putative peptidoglycan binding domain